eukprot:TRINITY_DN2205_c0_g1_i1.p1 TRINITY_DN2205_c0_g1~~TRINITY_DN2205_c0_g1_i1.p1  ORF type:complete len:344 (+),score=14.47 TRINITY_DN2205_c0_g1_i1:120-1151(+)
MTSVVDSVEVFPEAGFEGPEKKLEVDFRPLYAHCCPNGLRNIHQDEWSELLTYAKCSILSHTANEHFDAYVLSESSLFVYPRKIMIKTCGTTTLLNMLPRLMDRAKRLCLGVEFFCYSRKNYNFPHKQHFPHNDFRHEVDYLHKFFPSGQAHILGDVTGDHWNLFLCDLSTSRHGQEQYLEIMMSDLCPEKMSQFYKNEKFVTAKTTTRTSGISDIIPGSTIDEYQFEPCGYSMNGLKNEAYSTIHITPEPHCCYVSYDTNLSVPTYTSLVHRVIETFRPGKFQIALFLDKDSEAGHSKVAKLFDTRAYEQQYILRQKQKVKFPNNYFVLFYSFVSKTDLPSA